MVQATQGSVCIIKGIIDSHVENNFIKTVWQFQVIKGLSTCCIGMVTILRETDV